MSLLAITTPHVASLLTLQVGAKHPPSVKAYISSGTWAGQMNCLFHPEGSKASVGTPGDWVAPASIRGLLCWGAMSAMSLACSVFTVR